MPTGANADEQLFMYLKRDKRFRRVRSHEGKSWTQDQTLLVTRDTGLLCKTCHKRILWKDLDITFEMDGTDVIRLWWCAWCNNNIQTDNMADIQMRMDGEWDG